MYLPQQPPPMQASTLHCLCFFMSPASRIRWGWWGSPRSESCTLVLRKVVNVTVFHFLLLEQIEDRKFLKHKNGVQIMRVQEKVKMSVACKVLNYQLQSLLCFTLTLPHIPCVLARDSLLSLSIPYTLLTLVLLILFPEPEILPSSIYVDYPFKGYPNNHKVPFFLRRRYLPLFRVLTLALILTLFLVSVSSPLECPLSR